MPRKDTIGKMDGKFKAQLADPLVELLAVSWTGDEEYVRNWNADPVRDSRLYDTLWVIDNLRRLGYPIGGPLSAPKGKQRY